MVKYVKHTALPGDKVEPEKATTRKPDSIVQFVTHDTQPGDKVPIAEATPTKEERQEAKKSVAKPKPTVKKEVQDILNKSKAGS